MADKQLTHSRDAVGPHNDNGKFNFAIDPMYEFIELLGHGSYGIVCKARQTLSNKLQAIKKIPFLFDSHLITKRTLRELKVLKFLRKHENVIAIENCICCKNEIYFVFDLMESDLSHIIYSKQNLTDNHFKYFLYQIIKALKYIHSANIIHRDLKPSNLLVNENCQLKIGDFGLARGLTEPTVSASTYNLTQYVATRWYRAPEILYSSHDPYTYAIDLWAVGCIFSEMLLCKPLFPCKNMFELVRLVFYYLDAPSETYLSSIKSESFKTIVNAIIQQSMPKINFREFYPNLSDSGFDLLKSLLTIDPNKRLTATQALEHSYLTQFRDSVTEISAPEPFDFSFEQTNFMIDGSNAGSMELLKQALLDEANELIVKPDDEDERAAECLYQDDLDIASKLFEIDKFLSELDCTITEKPIEERKDTNDDVILIGSTTVKPDVKALLKQKILDQNSKAKVVGVKKSRKRRSTKASVSQSSMFKAATEGESKKQQRPANKIVPIRPKPPNYVPQCNSNVSQIYIHSNQPIIILQGYSIVNQLQDSEQDTIDSLTGLFSKTKVDNTESMCVSPIKTPRGTASAYSIGVESNEAYDNDCLLDDLDSIIKSFDEMKTPTAEEKLTQNLQLDMDFLDKYMDPLMMFSP